MKNQIILCMLMLMLSSFTALANEEPWVPHEYLGCKYFSKISNVDNGNGQVKHVITFHLVSLSEATPNGIKLFNISCNGSDGSDVYLELTSPAEEVSYDYEDEQPTSKWTWDVDFIK